MILNWLQRNDKLYQVFDYLKTQCAGRNHWGKAGWRGGEGRGERPGWSPAAAFDGAAEYGRSWCQFGCAVQQLDPGAADGRLACLWGHMAQLRTLAAPPADALCQL